MEQSQRIAEFDRFKSGEVTVLVASDVAARGLDVKGVSHVINFDVPWQPDDYIHRIGRTGRAGMTGIAITLATRADAEAVAAIEKLTGLKIARTPAKGARRGSLAPGKSRTGRKACRPECAAKASAKKEPRKDRARRRRPLAGGRGHQQRLERPAAQLPLGPRRLGNIGVAGNAARSSLAEVLNRKGTAMTDSAEYILPKVWTWDEPSGGQFANINRPVAGPTHDGELPVGKHPFQLYSLATPNGQKVAIMFEDLLERGHRDAEYDAWPVRIGEGDQFSSGFVAVNPNSKIPALLDRSGPEPIRVFESGAILIHLAEKFGEFLPASGQERAETLSWLMWQVGAAPFLGGGFGHFFAYAPEKFEYPINRYAMEAKRQLDLLNRQLGQNEYVAGPDYSIADIAIWPWYGGIALGRSYPGADEFLATHEYEHLVRWAKQIAQRPAVKRGRIVNKLTGDESEQLHERHDASDFELRTEDKIKGLAPDEAAAVKDDAI